MHVGGTQLLEPPPMPVSPDGRCPGAAVLPAWEVGAVGPPPEPPDEPPEDPLDDPLEPEPPVDPPEPEPPDPLGGWPDPPDPAGGLVGPPELPCGADGLVGVLGGGSLWRPLPGVGVGRASLGSGVCTGTREPPGVTVEAGVGGNVVGESGDPVFATLPDGLGTVAVADADGDGAVVGWSVETAGCTE